MTEPIAVPEKLSDLIRMAIADGRKLYQERAGEYLPDAHMFHELGKDSQQGKKMCHVCLAGAVMAGTLHADTRDSLIPSDFDKPWAKALHALDCVRQGMYGNALKALYGPGEYQLAVTQSRPVQYEFLGWDAFLDHLDNLGFVVGFFQDHGY